MRTLLTITSVCLLFAFLFPACGSNHMSIVKRKHLKGYHITTSHDKRHHKPIEVKQHTKQVNTQVEEDQLPLQESVSRETNPPVHQIREDRSTMETVPALAVKDRERSVVLGKFNPVEDNRPKAVKSLMDGIMKESSGDNDPWSLLWLIVVIILILWAIGLILELGSVIHLLLLVALILFILWLLKII